MSEHITAWLGAYHDGELHGARLRQVENHLAECAECRAALEEMQGLTTLLRETPPSDDFLPTERFVANLTLNLPRQPEPAQTPSLRDKALNLGWWLFPVGVLGAWMFIQITFSLSSVALTVSNSGLLGSNLAWLQGNQPQMEWFALATNLFGNQLGAPGQAILAELNETGVFITHLAVNLLPQAFLAVSYLGWLAAWWWRNQSQAATKTGNFSQS